MATPDIKNVVKFARATMLNAFNEARRESPFEGLVLREQDAGGILKFAVDFLPAIYVEFKGEAIPVGIDAKNLTVETVLHKNPVAISKKQAKNAAALIGDEQFWRKFRNSAKDAMFLVDAKIAALIEANSSDILGSAFFASGKAMPNSAQTITNTQSGSGVDTAAKIKTDFDAALTLMRAHKNAGGRSYHGGRLSRQRPVVLAPPALESIMRDVFEKDRDSSGETNRHNNKADLRIVEDFTDADDWFFVNSDPAYPPFIHLEDGPPDQHTNFDGNIGDADYLLRDRIIMNSDYSCDVAFGSRMEIVRTAN
jgi:hypothetical protein